MKVASKNKKAQFIKYKHVGPISLRNFVGNVFLDRLEISFVSCLVCIPNFSFPEKISILNLVFYILRLYSLCILKNMVQFCTFGFILLLLCCLNFFFAQYSF